MTLRKLKRVRWGVRAALGLGVAASVAGNVLHAAGGPVSMVIAGWAPCALLLTIELIARVPVHRRGLAVARWLATAVIAGIAAWVSYWHMAAVAARYGETGASPFLIPLSVDGLVVVASVCLVELGGRFRDAEASPARMDLVLPSYQYAEPIGPEPAPPEPDKLSANRRKRPPSSEDRVIAAHRRTPRASNETIAARLKVSVKTVERYRPDKLTDNLSDTQINGREPEMEGSSR